jgi:formate-dependent phosphoribosylglycinamide formyltransferase (GAR transformylase)
VFGGDIEPIAQSSAANIAPARARLIGTNGVRDTLQSADISRSAFSEPKTRTRRTMGIVLALDATTVRENKEGARNWIASKFIAICLAYRLFDAQRSGSGVNCLGNRRC